MFLLDTNAWIDHLRKSGASPVSRRLAKTGDSEIALCAVVRAELLFGSLRGPHPEQNFREMSLFLKRFHSLPFDDSAADIFAHIRVSLTAAGTPIGPNDLMIAAIALTNDLTLVTHNAREFGRVPGLKMEDWQASA